MTRILAAISAILVLVVIAVCACSYWVYQSLNTPREHSRSKDFIKIEKGSTPCEIIAKLASEGIISTELPTNIYLKLFGDASKLQAGEYQFPSPISAVQALKVLEKGEDRTIKLTIPEGFTRFDIAKRIVEKIPLSPPMDEKSVLALMDDTSSIKDVAPTAINLEGYMYPNTYSVPRDAKPQDVIKMMVDQFRKTWKPEWTEVARSAGRTPHQIVTIASLIETETGVESERPVVAGIIYNRLTKNIPLGIDQTVVYIANVRRLEWKHSCQRPPIRVALQHPQKPRPSAGTNILCFRKCSQGRVVSDSERLSLLRAKRRSQRWLTLVLLLSRRV